MKMRHVIALYNKGNRKFRIMGRDLALSRRKKEIEEEEDASLVHLVFIGFKNRRG